jgi:chemotaxis protein methyltransferase CheR
MISLELSDHHFERIRAIVYRNCGISLHESKKVLLSTRLRKRLRATGCKSYGEYLKLLKENEGGDELIMMLDAVSTNTTGFFREMKHFEFLRDTVFPSYQARGLKRLRLWSAGCSSGEESYTLAICLLEYFGEISSFDIKILATDISTKVLNQAAEGIYSDKRLVNIPKYQLSKYFQRGTGKRAGFYRIKPELRQMVEFRRHNLMHKLEFEDSFHLIFCRNVMIYFDNENRQAIVERFHRCLLEGGYLVLGHAESIVGTKHQFRYIQPSVYQK